MKLYPVIPDKIEETLIINFVYFKTETIKLVCQGIYEACTFTLPRRLVDGKIISPKDTVDNAFKNLIIRKFCEDYDGPLEGLERGLEELEF